MRKDTAMRIVCTVKVLQDYRLDLTFDDGVRGQVDLSDLVGRGGALWREYHVFEQVRICSFGELALIDIAKPVEPSEVR